MKTAIILFIFIGALASLIAPFYQTEDQGTAIGFAVLIFGALFYFLPAIVAKGRQHSVAIFVLNLLLGWTFIGWVAALIWACAAQPNSPKTPPWQALVLMRMESELSDY